MLMLGSPTDPGTLRYSITTKALKGMDPYSRRSTWNIVRSAREGRVVVLTTHFMDEAISDLGVSHTIGALTITNTLGATKPYSNY